MTNRIAIAALLLTLSLPTMARPTWADDDPTPQKLAELLQRTTVTVRIQLSPRDIAAAERAARQARKPAVVDEPSQRVTVCSGVSLGNGLIVTSAFAGTDSGIRITVPGGDQVGAQLKVIDGYSGLVLLEADDHNLPGIPLADQLPATGGRIMRRRVWGVQQPVVSLGIVSAIERTIAGSTYPPLVQCDLRTADTSSGGAIIDGQGKLSGVIVLTGEADQRHGWTYAVPVSHVKRLLRVLAEKKKAAGDRSSSTGGSKDGVVVLKRRRPVVGMVLGGGQDEVVVRRVTPGSPAERAGLQLGDEVLGVDGAKIRSVYQAVRPVLFKQPGDLVRYQVRRGERTWMVDVALGGGVELPSAPFESLAKFMRPKVDVEGMAEGGYRTRTGRGEVREVFAPSERIPELEHRNLTTDQRIELLQKALDRYRNVIEYQQGELKRRDLERQQLEKQLKEMQRAPQPNP